MSARTPHINTGLDDRVTLAYPKDPIQIGTAIQDGNPVPIWIDPQQFILTPDQKLEQASKMKGDSIETSLMQARWEAAALVEKWLGRCIQEMCPVAEKGQEAVKEWLQQEDISYVEDTRVENQVHFILKRGEKVLSEFFCNLKSSA